MDRILNPLSDIFVRFLLGSENNKDILEDFINAVFIQKDFPLVRDVVIKNPFHISETTIHKESILDVKAVDNLGRIINVEIQVANEKNFIQRVMYYWAKSFQGQLNKGDKYSELSPVISINLVDFTVFHDLEGFHSCFQVTEKDNPEYILTDQLQIHFIELLKLKNLREENLNDKLLAWCYYFRNEGTVKEGDMPELLKNDKFIRKAHKAYQRFTANEALMQAIEAREKWERDHISRNYEARKEGLQEGIELGMKKGRVEGLEKGRAEGIELGLKKGRQEGILDNMIQIAREMKKSGFPEAEIIRLTGLSEDQFQNL